MSSDQEALAVLQNPHFDPRETVVMTTDPHVSRVAQGTAAIHYDSPTRASLDVNLAADGVVVVSDMWDPGWRAELDGAGCSILRADAALTGLRVPAGKHSIQLIYDPRSLRLGAAIAATAAFVLLLLAGGTSRNKCPRSSQRLIAMSTTVQWYEIVFRLLLTVIGGALIGFNRTEHGRPAGLRTTMLVCLAASISMIQANLLMNTVGKAGNSFIVLDLMRLPLGILTGVGFIGAGAILRKENRVLGVTTAATLWFVTVMGLCFGGGQLGLGVTALVIGLIVLGGLKQFEAGLPQDRQGTLILTIGPGGIADDLACKRILLAGFEIVSLGVTHDNVEQTRELSCEVRWQARADKSEKTRESELLDELAGAPGRHPAEMDSDGRLDRP